MAWDLKSALLKKQEVESARLADFEFRWRARTMAILAPLVDTNFAPFDLVRQIAVQPDDAIIEDLGRRFPEKTAELPALYEQSRALARKQLIGELGDPSPYRLA